MDRRPEAAPMPLPVESAPGATTQAVVLGRLVELWSLIDAASRTYALRARVVPAPTRLLLWSLAHRRTVHATRLMAIIAQPEWAGSLVGHTDAVSYLRRFRGDAAPDEPDLSPLDALQRTGDTEALIAERCAKLIAATAHTLVEHALRWQLADTRFAQHQIEVLLGMLGIVPRRPTTRNDG